MKVITFGLILLSCIGLSFNCKIKGINPTYIKEDQSTKNQLIVYIYYDDDCNYTCDLINFKSRIKPFTSTTHSFSFNIFENIENFTLLCSNVDRSQGIYIYTSDINWKKLNLRSLDQETLKLVEEKKDAQIEGENDINKKNNTITSNHTQVIEKKDNQEISSTNKTDKKEEKSSTDKSDKKEEKSSVEKTDKKEEKSTTDKSDKKEEKSSEEKTDKKVEKSSEEKDKKEEKSSDEKTDKKDENKKFLSNPDDKKKNNELEIKDIPSSQREDDDSSEQKETQSSNKQDVNITKTEDKPLKSTSELDQITTENIEKKTEENNQTLLVNKTDVEEKENKEETEGDSKHKHHDDIVEPTPSNEFDESNEIAKNAFYLTVVFLSVFVCLFVYNVIRCYTKSSVDQKNVKKHYSRELQSTDPEDSTLDINS